MSLREELPVAFDVVRTRLRVEWLLATRPLDECLRELSSPASLSYREPDPRQVTRIGRWTRRLLRNRAWTRTTCLQRSLTRYALLVRTGAKPTFVMGLRDPTDIEGHAWVVLDGAPWMEHTVDGLTSTFEYPPADE